MWTVTLPLAVQISSKTWMMLNLNVYRNAHHRTLDKAKKEFTKEVTPRIRHLPKLNRALVTYELFTPTKRTVDLANVISIVDKFFSDTLVNAGKLEDDNCKILPYGLSAWGGIDINNPRVEATIHSIGPNEGVQFTIGPSS